MKAKLKFEYERGCEYRWEMCGDDFKLVRSASLSDSVDPIDLFDSPPDDALFINFSRLHGCDRRQLLKFANEYGLLFADSDMNVESTWRTSIGTLHNLVTQWQSSGSSDEALDVCQFHLCVFSMAITAGSHEKTRRQRAKVTPPAATIIVPCLIDALWAQFAEAIVEGFTFKNCDVCNRAIRDKKNRLFCSQTCRSKYYKTRRARALEMYKLGQSVQEVVECLGVDASLATSWRARAGIPE